MKELLLFIKEGKFIKRNFQDRNDFFKQVSYQLLEDGYVSDGFYKEILKREENFPTGIQTKTFGVSIPHCESEYVLKNAIIVTVFDNPIDFYRMDDPDNSIKAHIAFMLLIKDKEKHISTLQQLTILFQSNVLSEIVDKNSLEEVLELIKEEFDVKKTLKGIN